MKEEFSIFLTALMFYTRIPVPKNLVFSEEKLNKATRYFPLIGTIVGCFTALIFWIFQSFLPKDIALFLSIISGIIVTGAFHEDGLADVCDGFGGGYSKEQRLKIMKDSRIGNYGAIGLMAILALKFLLLRYFDPKNIVVILIVSHTLSRLMPVVVIFFGKYSRLDELSKVKPIGKKIKPSGFILAIFFSLFPFILFLSGEPFILIPILVVATLLMMKYFQRRIDGYTGDCLGFIQQVSEVIIYIGYLVICLNVDKELIW